MFDSIMYINISEISTAVKSITTKDERLLKHMCSYVIGLNMGLLDLKIA